MSHSPLFTRFLYIKTDVYWSLLISLLNHDVNKSLFWFYELYYSGFKYESIQFVMQVFNKIYKPVVPRCVLRYIIAKDYPTEEDMASILSLIAYYNGIYSSSGELRATETVKCENQSKKRMFIIYEKSDIRDYQTTTISMYKQPYRVLRSACIYNSVKNVNTLLYDALQLEVLTPGPIPREQIVTIFRSKSWLYYAWFTPVWNERLTSCSAIPNHETCEMVFDIDTFNEELFHSKYGYEPDEQPIKVFNNCICES